MSHDGGTAQPSCTTVPLGKSVRRALRAAIGVPKKPRKDRTKMKPKKKPNQAAAEGSSSGYPELMIMSLSKEAAAARKESVVRVVLSSGVVEVYPGVVLACTVIRRHPPGLCLAHPDVFRNPHGALLRPHEPLFPGQKFLLIPWSTYEKLKHKIPESSVGAFADGDADDEDDQDTAGSEEISTETEASEDGQERRHSSGAPAEEWDDEAAAAGDGSGSFMAACSARGYFEARDRWSACRFKRLVKQDIAVEPSADDDDQQPDQRKDKQARKKGNNRKKKRKGNKTTKRRGRPAAAPLPGFRAFATLRRTWEPSLPSVEEEENAVSPLSDLHSPAASVG